MREHILSRLTRERASIDHSLASAPVEEVERHFALLYDQLHRFAVIGNEREYRAFARRFLSASLAEGMEPETVVHTVVTLGDHICRQHRGWSGDIESARGVRDQARVCFHAVRIFVDEVAESLQRVLGEEPNA